MMANTQEGIIRNQRVLDMIEEEIEEISDVCSEPVYSTVDYIPRSCKTIRKDSGFYSHSSSKSQEEIDRIYECDDISQLSVSLISDESFDGSISSLFSDRSFSDEKRPPKSRIIIGAGIRAVRKNLFGDFEKSGDDYSDAFDGGKIDLKRTSFIEKIEKIKNKSSKSLETKKNLLGLVKQYKLFVHSRDDLSRPNTDRTATVSLGKIHFPEVTRKIGRNLFFLVVTDGIQVQVSKFVKLAENYLTFPDEFVFENCPINFKITVQLYAHELPAQIHSFFKKAAKPFLKRQSSRKNLMKETSAFRLIEEFPITIKDLQSRKIGSFRDIISNSKMYSTSLKVDRLSLTINKSGFVQIRHFNGNYCNWTKNWCVLSDSNFHVYQSDYPSCDPEYQHTQKFDLYDLRYCTLTKLDLTQEILVFKCVRSHEGEKDDVLPRLKSSNNFVIEEFHIKSNVANLFLWREALNDVIRTLSSWNQSFLERDEINM